MDETLNDDKSYRNQYGLTKKQEAFAQAVLIEDSYSDAYRVAYDCSNMSDVSINKEAYRLAKDPHITPRISELRDRASSAADITIERIMREQGRLAFTDPADIYNEDGSLKALSEMTVEARSTIAGIETEKRWIGSGDEAEEVTITKVKQHSKGKALDALTRMQGGYEKDNRQKGDIMPKIPSVPEWAEPNDSQPN